MTQLCLEDLHAGQTLISPAVLLTEADILAYAREFDPQPMHIDKQQASLGPFDGLIASGWHTAALAIELQRQAGLASADLTEIVSLSWPRPVRPGDNLHAEIEIRSIEPASAQPGYGLVEFQNTVRNGSGETVEIMLGTVLVARRSGPAK